MQIFELPLRRRVRCLRFVPGASAVTALGDRLRYLATFSVSTLDMVRWHPETSEQMIGFDYSADGSLLAVAFSHGVARPYRVGETPPITALHLSQHFTTRQRYAIHSIMFSRSQDPKRQWLAVAGTELWLWNALTQQYLVSEDNEAYHAGLAFDPSGESIFVTGEGFLSKWSIRPFLELWRVEHPGRLDPDGPEITVSSNGLIVVAGSKEVAVFDPESGEVLQSLPVELPPLALEFVPESPLLAVVDGSSNLRWYDTTNGRLAREYDWGIGDLATVAFSQDGAMGAAGSTAGRIVVWDAD